MSNEIELKLRDVVAAVTEAEGKWLNGDYRAATFLTHPSAPVQVRMTHETYMPGQRDFWEPEDELDEERE